MTKRQFTRKKTMHILLYDARVDDYETVRAFYGIENDNDLVRFLFAITAKRIELAKRLDAKALIEAYADAKRTKTANSPSSTLEKETHE